MNKRTLSRSALIILLSMISAQSPSPAAGDAAGESRPLRIGVTLPLRGSFADYSISAVRGLQLAGEDVNAGRIANARKVEILVEDNQGDTQKAVGSVLKLITSDRVDALFTAYSFIVQAVKSTVANSRKVLFYQATHPKVAEEYPMGFMDFWSVQEGSRLLAQKALREGKMRFSALIEERDQCISALKAFRAAAPQIEIIREDHFMPDEKDYRSMLLRIGTDRPQAILLCTINNDNLIFPQMRVLNLLNIQVFGHAIPFHASCDTAEMRAMYEKNGTVSSWFDLNRLSLTVDGEKLKKTYVERFGENPRPDFFIAYDDVLFLARAGVDCDLNRSASSACLASHLSELKLPGSELTVFDEKRVARRSSALIHVEGGEWKPLPAVPSSNQ